MSGSTEETLQTDWFVLRVSTPCMNFVTTPPDPVTGKTHEQEYHEQASRRFKPLLETLSTPMQSRLGGILEEAGAPQLLPYDAKLTDAELTDGESGPVRQSILIAEVEMFDLDFCLSGPMEQSVRSKVQDKLRELVRSSLLGTGDERPV